METKPLPHVEPILALLKKEPFDDHEWSFEFKYDGFRGLLHVESNGRAYFLSKKKKHLARFDSFARKIAAELRIRNCILDGEIVVMDPTKRPQFLDLMFNRKAPKYVAFDLLHLNDRDLRGLPLTERRKRLRRTLPKNSELFSEAFSVKGSGRSFFKLMCDLDLEGMIAKRYKDPYNTDTIWYKIKNTQYSQLEGRAKLFHRKRAI